jgi:hypothetical protein
MCRGLHHTTAFAAVAGDQLALLRIETLVLRDDPLVETPLAQGLAFGLFGCRWLPELQNIRHGTRLPGLVKSHPFEPGFHPLDERLGLVGTH